jgi:hypothetical protein
MYYGCPIVWQSQMATEVAMSSTGYALIQAIPIMDLLEEMKVKEVPIGSSQAKIHCWLVEDNSGALEIKDETSPGQTSPFQGLCHARYGHYTRDSNA